MHNLLLKRVKALIKQDSSLEQTHKLYLASRYTHGVTANQIYT